MREEEYLKKVFERFGVSSSVEKLVKDTIKMPTYKRDEILNNLRLIKKIAGLSLALITLFRQQVNSGFVLGDPLNEKEERLIKDDKTGINFILTWNPDRELRKDHKKLIERGIIAEKVDKKRLVNIDSKGKACYLCWKNILEQNPGEIILKVKLADEFFYIGSNFAYITNNHFTIMNSKHRPQIFRAEIINFMLSFVEKTNSFFRIIYNGLAGASIKEHEHLQATSESFPVESVNKGEAIIKDRDFELFSPVYYVPLFIVKGKSRRRIKEVSTYIIKEWESISENNTENLMMMGKDREFYLFIFLRDKKKLRGNGKSGALASFEVSGRMVLSVNNENFNERQIFEKEGIWWIRKVYEDIKPEEKMVQKFKKQIFSYFGGKA